MMNQLVREQQEELRTMQFQDPSAEASRLLIQMNLRSAESLYTQDNEVKFFTDGTNKFADLLSMIEQAKHHIHIQYYIYRGDHLGQTLIEALAKKAAARGRGATAHRSSWQHQYAEWIF